MCTWTWHRVVIQGGGGGGGSPQILVGMCRSKVKNGGLGSELERENAGLQSKLERESGVSGTDCRTHLAGTLAGR